MNNLEFIEKAKLMAKKKTVYLWGGWGNPLTYAIIDSKARQYRSVYYPSKVSRLKALVPQDYLGVDCSGMLKAIHWGYPNQKYNNGGMPDTNANTYINMCKGVSTNFSSIIPGEVVWMNGHIGLYVGVYDNVKWVIESTPNWKDGVQWVRLDARKWKKHGQMPNVTYITDNKTEEAQPMSKGNQVTATALNVRTGPSTNDPVLTTLKKGDTVKIESTQGKWVKLSAWVSGDYISQEVAKGKVITGSDNLNVRSGPNTKFPIVKKLSNNTVVTIVERTGDWIKIANGEYVHGNFVVAI